MIQRNKENKILTNPGIFFVVGIINFIFFLVDNFYIRAQTNYYYYPTNRLTLSHFYEFMLLSVAVVYIIYGTILKIALSKKLIRSKYTILKRVSLFFILLLVFWVVIFVPFIIDFILHPEGGPNPLPFPRKSAL